MTARRPSNEALLEASCKLEESARSLRCRAQDAEVDSDLDIASDFRIRAEQFDQVALWLDTVRLGGEIQHG